MPRPQKRRRVCGLPYAQTFGPLSKNSSTNQIILTVDEYESLRLIDHENLTQQECAEQMNVARTTIQSIYAQARRKVASTLVKGDTLIIEGGSYELCNGKHSRCFGNGCHNQRTRKKCRKESPDENRCTHE